MSKFVLALATLALFVAPLAAQQYVEAPSGTWINDVSADGSTVVGTLGSEAFYWNWRTDPAPTLLGPGQAYAVSADGTYIVGTIDHPVSGADVAARWSQVTGWQIAGELSTCGSISTGFDISDDGDKVVGLAWNGCSAVGFLWTFSTGTLALQSLANGNNRASGISGDGSRIGGFAMGNFDRTPAVWDAGTTNGLAFDPSDVGEIHGLSNDGQTIVGTYWFGVSNYYSAAIGDPTNGFVTELGALDPLNYGGQAYDISEDGDTVAGFDVNGLARVAWLWRDGIGFTSIPDLVTEVGGTSALDFQTCIATSDDGLVVVGSGFTGLGFESKGYIIEIEPQDSPWTDLGGDTNGINGHPHLSGTGTLVAGTATNIDLVNGPNGAISVVWTSLASVPFNVAGGTIYANPYVSEILIPLNGSGEFHAAFPWFAGVPSGLQLHFQFLIQDLSRVYGFSLSNGLRATAP